MAAKEMPYLGEIRIFSFNFAPQHWMPCEGQALSIEENKALFSVIGTSYGGNGSTHFLLPDLRGRVPRHVESGAAVGRPGGHESVTLTTAEMPLHNHYVHGTDAQGTAEASPTSQLSNSAPASLYASSQSLVAMHPGAIGFAGKSYPHENRQPLLALNFCICIAGFYPNPNTGEA
ncbi:MAG TPA: tail fiber protein [Marmoricola sp.]|jgi:microcystin-dependent protein|nr:tail fiber protein [Marmoricola sp.]